MKYIKLFEEIRMSDVGLVGGKNASLGEMITQLTKKGIRIPSGFAITADAYWYYISHNQLLEKMQIIMAQLTDISNMAVLQKVGNEMRAIIMNGTIPSDLSKEIIQAYHLLSERYGMPNCDVAVRSSATAEDLPIASFAGQQDTFLNVHGNDQLLDACKKSIASLFTDRAIVYRIEQGFDHFRIALSIGVQKMIRSDSAVSGVAFSLDTESGFKDVVMIESSYGLGESIVKGLVTPDEFMVHKPTLAQGFRSIIKKQRGDKSIKLIYADESAESTKSVVVSDEDQKLLSLTDDEVLQLARYVVIIEDYYSSLKGSWSPMDIEWAKDGVDGLLYIIQARPETVMAGNNYSALKTYSLENKEPVIITTGLSVGRKIVSGIARVIKTTHDIGQVNPGDIIVTEMTDPDWVPVVKQAAGIITNWGGRTCHAAIVSRELGIPAIVGTKNGTDSIKNGSEITIDCSRGTDGYIYSGQVPFVVHETDIHLLVKPAVDIMVNCAAPASAFQLSFLPVTGVGLARLEFIITSMIQVHPMALIYPEKVDNETVRRQIDSITAGYVCKKDFFVQKLAESIGIIAAAFYPRPVIVRFSDFKTNEYRNLIGGAYFESVEENPMIGFRGAARYCDIRYKKAFALECAAIKYVRNVMGLRNVKVMIPFVRTVSQAEKVIDEMESNGLARGRDNLEVLMMCEIPSNVLLIEKFSQFFDGFSIGSNDLTQLVLGVDRDSGMLGELFNEEDEAVKKMMVMAIEGAHEQRKYIGICGQAPSDYPELADFLIKHTIDSLSLNADSVIPFLTR